MIRSILGIPRKFFCHAAAALFSAFIIAPLTFMLLDRELPVVQTPAELNPSQVRPGQIVELIWKADVRRLCKGTVSRQWVDSEGVIFYVSPDPTVARANPTHLGPDKMFSRDVVIPSGMSPGQARMVVDIEYRCNIMHSLWPIQAPTLTTSFFVN